MSLKKSLALASALFALVTVQFARAHDGGARDVGDDT